VILAASLSFFDAYVTNAMRTTATEMKKSQQLIQEWALLEDSDRKTALNSLKSAANSFDSYESYFMYASALMNEGDYVDSILAFDKAIELKPAKEAYLNKGVAFQNLAKFNDAIKALTAGLTAISDSYNSDIFQSKLHYNLASTYLDVYQSQLEDKPDDTLLVKAESHLVKADRGLRGNSKYQGDLYGLKGLLFEFTKDYAKSIKMYDNALSIRTANFFGSKEARDIAVTNNNVGSLLLKGFFESQVMKQRAYREALEYSEKALYVFDAGNYGIEKAFALYNIGEAYYKLAQPLKALEHLKSSHAIFKSYASPYASKVDNLIAKIKDSLD
jgi:tetratricopeptide (TPR) repeat protein